MKLTLSFVAGLAFALGACATTKPAAPTQPTPGATAAADGIRFPLPRPKVGDAVTETEEQSMVMTIEVSPTRRVDLMSRERRTVRNEVVALDGTIVAKVKVRYLTVTAQETVDGTSRAKPTPTAGKTYLVWREGGELEVSYEDGSAPSAAELKEVRKGNRSVGRPAAVEQIIAARAWKVGETFALSPAQLVEVNQGFGYDGDESLTSMTLTLHSVDDSVATLAMSMGMAMQGEDGGELTAELAGTISLDRATGRLLDVGGTGPFSGFVTVKMVGTMSTKSTYTY
jgi:hypothetical protein